jgi:predicted AAA+ superfamily ATPase
MKSTSYSIIETISRHRQEFLGFRELPYWKRTQEKTLADALDSTLIKVVLGPRRAGKSRLIQHALQGREVGYINFEEEQFIGLSADQIIDAAIQVYPVATHWYFDEVQMFPRWETVLNKLQRRGFNLTVTGSNAKLLSSEITTALTGRHVAIELLPFSYGEVLAAKNDHRSWSTFQHYLERGGYPEVILDTPIDFKSYLRALFDSTVLTDLVTRRSVRNPQYLRNTLSIIVNNVTARTSARSISKALNGIPSAVTVEKYIAFGQEAYLVETTRPFSSKTKERIQGERKPYLIDTGFLTALTSGVMPVLGKQLENSVYLELRRRGLKNDLSLFHYRPAGELEIDFIVRDSHETTELIQVCLEMTSMEAKAREVRALSTASQAHPQAQLTIVTANEAGSLETSTGKKIQIVPAYDFCR